MSDAEGFHATGAQVQIHGFPFLTQLLTNNFRHVSIHLDAGYFEGFEVRDVRVEAFDVHTAAPWRAGLIDVDVVVMYEALELALQQQVNAPITVAADPNVPGTLIATSQITVLGFSVPISIHINPTIVSGNALNIDIEYVNVAGAEIAVDQIPLGLGDVLDDLAVALPLPDGVSLLGVEVLPDGLRIQGQAAEISLEDFVGPVGS